MRFKQLYEADKSSTELTTKAQVLEWLARHNVVEHERENKNNYDSAYEIYSDLSVDLESGYEFKLDTRVAHDLKELPIHFSKCAGSIDLSNSNISSWKNFPTSWDNSDNPTLNIDGTEFKSFTGMPEFDGSSLHASHLAVHSVEGLNIGHNCEYVYLLNLHTIKDLKGFPPNFEGYLQVGGQSLVSLEGLPPKLNSLVINAENMTSLSKIHRYVKECISITLVDMDNLTSHMLGILRIKGLKTIFSNNIEDERVRAVIAILDNHLGKEDAVLKAQDELIDKGFEDFAQL